MLHPTHCRSAGRLGGPRWLDVRGQLTHFGAVVNKHLLAPKALLWEAVGLCLSDPSVVCAEGQQGGSSCSTCSMPMFMRIIEWEGTLKIILFHLPCHATH